MLLDKTKQPNHLFAFLYKHSKGLSIISVDHGSHFIHKAFVYGCFTQCVLLAFFLCFFFFVHLFGVENINQNHLNWQMFKML